MQQNHLTQAHLCPGLGVFPPAIFLDWALVGDSCEGIEDTEGDHPWTVKGVCPKPKGRWELPNLERYINYDAYGSSSRRGKGKAYAV